jgi:hypothetical protein
MDIGFSGSDPPTLDESALTSFVGNNDGFVTTWYAQSPNGRGATQSNDDSQPKIVESGSILKRDGYPIVTYEDGDYFQVGNFDLISTSSGGTVFLVGYPPNDSSVLSKYDGPTSNESWGFYFNTIALTGPSGANFYNTSSDKLNQKLLTTHDLNLGAQSSIRRNGSEDKTYTPQSSLNDNNVNVELNRINTSINPTPFAHEVFEIVIYDTEPDISGIESNILSYYSI